MCGVKLDARIFLFFFFIIIIFFYNLVVLTGHLFENIYVCRSFKVLCVSTFTIIKLPMITKKSQHFTSNNDIQKLSF